MKRFTWLVCLTLLAAAMGHTAASEETFAAASRLLSQGRAAEALPQLRQLAETSRQGVVWFNLGNCLLELDRPVWARVAYLRADKYLPGDSAIARNLALLRARFPTPADPGPESGWIAFFRELRRHLPPGQLALVILAASWGAALLWLGWLLRPRRLWLYGLFLALIVGGLAAGAMVLEQQAITRITRGVVLHGEVELLSAPETGATVLFTLPAGQEVRWIERRGDWLSVAASTQMAGWTEASNVEGI